MPILFLGPVLVLLAALLVRTMFLPLQGLAVQLGKRLGHDPRELDRMPLPSEVWPFVSEINKLIARTARALALQRRFIADAAHELHPSMTTMSLQAERLAATDMPDADASVSGRAKEIRLLVKNLVDNAIRYTPAGGRVDIGVTAADDRIVLDVDDTGPGIAPDERERVFDPFYRVLGSGEIGSGLGPAITASIVDRISATISLLDRPDGARGRRARVAFPGTAVRIASAGSGSPNPVPVPS